MSIVHIREEFETEEQANQCKQSIISCYPPAGYDTSLQVYQQPANGKWIVSGYRYSSCD